MMNTLVAVCIAPCGTGDSYSPYVAQVVKIIRESGLTSVRIPCLRKSKASGTSHGCRQKSHLLFGRAGIAHGSRAESRYPAGPYAYDGA